jgi:hypothetical protein
MHTFTNTFIFYFYHEFLIIIKAYLNMEITILPIYSMFQRPCLNRPKIGFIRADNIKIQGFHFGVRINRVRINEGRLYINLIKS